MTVRSSKIPSFLLLSAIASGSCGSQETVDPPATETTVAAPVFVDVSVQAHLDFRHRTGATGGFYFPEIMGAGVAIIDFDQDGLLDVYAIQSGNLLDYDEPRGDALFRNMGGSPATFERLPETAGIVPRGYGQGAAVADVDSNGYPDLFLSAYGPDQLWLNTGKGTFASATLPSDNEPWSSSALFFDYDNDGDEDIFVTHYVHYTLDANVPCFFKTGVLNYCSPNAYRPTRDKLLRNGGGGRFDDVTTAVGIGASAGNGLSAVAIDINLDGWLDVYVANDQMANVLWINQAGTGFVESALDLGLAFNMNGESEASMGIAIADFDGESGLDIFLTHLARQTNTLYLRNGAGWYDDQTARFDLATASVPYTGFGTVALDANMDGLSDIFVANGSVHLDNDDDLERDSFPFGEYNQLFVNTEGHAFYQAGSGLEGVAYVSRGVAVGDLDNDGDPDLLISNAEGPLQYFDNRHRGAGHWVGLILESENGSRLAHCSVTIGSGQWRRTIYNPRDGSYLSSSDDRILLALPAGPTGHLSADVSCPGGRSAAAIHLEADTYQRVEVREAAREDP